MLRRNSDPAGHRAQACVRVRPWCNNAAWKRVKVKLFWRKANE